MEKKRFIYQKLEQLLEIEIFFVSREGMFVAGQQKHHPIGCSSKLRELLMLGAAGQEAPFLHWDPYGICFGCIFDGSNYMMLGPMSPEPLTGVRMHHYYRHYGIRQEDEKPLRRIPLRRILNIMEVIAWEVQGKEYSDEELLYSNHMAEMQDARAEQVLSEEFDMDNEGRYHHTYNEERRLLDYIREGNVAAAVASTKRMDSELGMLSDKELNHWKNVAIAAITLCTRAAIDGGVAPSVAYHFSDSYIRKCDCCTEVAQVLECRDHAVEEIAGRVKERQKNRSKFNHVEKCKDYVENHYREKIYQDDIAKALGISGSYLSRLFSRETGVRLQDYIVQVRVEHAANLLKYSDKSIAHIAEYVNFPSQSYMGKMFQKYKHLSPREYRELRKPTGF